ncbi:MAG: ABC transporter substrate-binding protein [Acidimicrobiales bacterium]|nr:ABC transporter substrate-binding protein [Acidimicrobiales bacterium]
MKTSKRQSRTLLRLLAVLLSFSLVAVACGDDDGDDGASGDGTSDDGTSDDDMADDGGAATAPEPAPGFDGSTIRVGVISDLSGPAALIGAPLTAGGQVYYDYINSQGGVAGQYMIETAEADHAYNPTTAVQVYNDMKDDVAIVGQLLGTPITNAVLESLKADNVVASPASLDAFWVPEQNLLPLGAPYQIQVINGLDWWINEGGGSTDQVYCTFVQDDPYGEAGQAGAEFAAERLGITIADTATYVSGAPDYSAQIQQLAASGCEVVFLTALPSTTGEALGAAASAEFTPQWIAQSPAWINALAESPLAPYLEAYLVIVGEGATWGDDSIPGMAEMVANLEAFAPEQAPDYYFVFGYLQAIAVVKVLEQAVANGDLSREGIIEALNGLGETSFDGLSGDYFYGPPADRVPPTENTIFKVNPAVPNGVEAIVTGYESDFASEFEF